LVVVVLKVVFLGLDDDTGQPKHGSNQWTLKIGHIWFGRPTKFGVFFFRHNPIKMDDLGVPPFQETSICQVTLFIVTIEYY
jgi:hypothetical protein